MNNTNVKILFVCDDLMLGGWTSLVTVAIELKKRGLKIQFITLFGKGYNAELLEKEGINVKCIFLNKFNFPFKILKLLLLILQIKPDIIHTHLHYSDCFAIPLAYLAGVRKRIAHIHSIGEKYKHKLTFLKKVTYRLTTNIIAVSKAAKEAFKIENPFCNVPIEVIPNCIDVFGFRRRFELSNYKREDFYLTESDFVVLCVANFKWQKGYEYLLGAVEQLQNENFKFLIIGYGEEKEKILKITQRKSLDKVISFLGARTDVPEIMKIADCLILPSIVESFGICIIEAFSVGLPVIASSVGGIVEIAKNNENAILINPGNVEQICKALCLLKYDDKLRRSLANKAKIHSENYDVAKVANKIIDYYRGILIESF
ncbi:MAG TPA: glycosyltransferase family 4 protein [Victivallales bacterium]|nr:glycosyltransferase family 4 protein [Victivallales bacterium]HPO90963.1 glycosyltransferase family 4 protein [Victivallales bacterium]HRR28193.1 glycosyltransferase family 4 protein [Victivallales bacterium]HRU00913.1 glycosyltransferase family 4 protein [Victivallales bacterium]